MTPFGHGFKSPAQAPLCPLCNVRDLNPRHQKWERAAPTMIHPWEDWLEDTHTHQVSSFSLVLLPSSPKPRGAHPGKHNHSKQSHVRKLQRIRQDRTGYVGLLLELEAALLSSLGTAGKAFWVAKARSRAKRLFLGMKNPYLRWEGTIQELHCATAVPLCRCFCTSSTSQALLLLFVLLNEVYLTWQKGSFLALAGQF